MKRFFITILAAVVLFTSACSIPISRKWDNTDKALAVASTLAVAADAITTMKVLDDGGYERNPIMGKHPSDGRVIGTLAATHAIFILIAHYVPQFRKLFLGVKTALNAGCAIWNSKL